MHLCLFALILLPVLDAFRARGHSDLDSKFSIEHAQCFQQKQMYTRRVRHVLVLTSLVLLYWYRSWHTHTHTPKKIINQPCVTSINPVPENKCLYPCGLAWTGNVNKYHNLFILEALLYTSESRKRKKSHICTLKMVLFIWAEELKLFASFIFRNKAISPFYVQKKTKTFFLAYSTYTWLHSDVFSFLVYPGAGHYAVPHEPKEVVRALFRGPIVADCQGWGWNHDFPINYPEP